MSSPTAQIQGLPLNRALDKLKEHEKNLRVFVTGEKERIKDRKKALELPLEDFNQWEKNIDDYRVIKLETIGEKYVLTVIEE